MPETDRPIEGERGGEKERQSKKERERERETETEQGKGRELTLRVISAT